MTVPETLLSVSTRVLAAGWACLDAALVAVSGSPSAEGGPLGHAARMPGFLPTLFLAALTALLVLAIWAVWHKCSRRTRELTESHNILSAIFESMPDPVFIKDLEGRFIRVNTAAVFFLGKTTPEEVLGRTAIELLPPELAAPVTEQDETILRTGLAVTVQQTVLTATGPRPAISTKAPYRDARGAVVGIIGVDHDLSALRQEETRRHEHEAHFRMLFNAVADPVWVIDADTGRFTDVNDAACRLFGHSREEFGKLSVTDIEVLENPDESRQRLHRILETGGDRFETRLRTRTGNVLDTAIHIRTVAIDDRPHLLAIVRDITRERQAHEELRESEARFRTVFEEAGDGMLIVDPATLEILVFNETASTQRGFSREEFARLNVMDLQVMRTREEVDELFRSILDGEVRRYHTQHRCRDGSILEGAVISTPMTLKGRRQILAIIRDVTEENAMVQALTDSNHEKEILLREIHHRVKNNLQIVSSLLRLQAHQTGDPVFEELLAESHNRINSMALVHEELYESEALADIDFREYLRKLSERLLRVYARGGHVALDIRAEKAHFPIDTAIPLGLILNELLSNAFKHGLPAGRTGTVTIGLVPSGDDWELTVGDDGAGLPEGFVPGETGTLGMQLLFSLADQLGGSFEILTPETGAAFRLRFPFQAP